MTTNQENPDTDKDIAQKGLAGYMASCPVGVYTHRKGGEYILYSHSLDESSLRPLVHYYSVTKANRWTREVVVWNEPVDGRPRFWFIRPATKDELILAAGITIP